MPAVINDPDFLRTVLRRRRAEGRDRHDEVWNGVHIMNAMPNNEHQLLVLRLCFVLKTLIGDRGLGVVLPGANISDRQRGWKKNFRCPDVVVFLQGNSAVDCGEFWLGGPDIAIEIVSPHDRSRQKLSFYAQLGTREVLIVDRRPWQLERYRLADGRMELAGKSTADSNDALSLETVRLKVALRAAEPRPVLVMTSTEDGREWTA